MSNVPYQMSNKYTPPIELSLYNWSSQEPIVPDENEMYIQQLFSGLKVHCNYNQPLHICNWVNATHRVTTNTRGQVDKVNYRLNEQVIR